MTHQIYTPGPPTPVPGLHFGIPANAVANRIPALAIARALHILRAHRAQGDRYTRAATERLIAADMAALRAAA